MCTEKNGMLCTDVKDECHLKDLPGNQCWLDLVSTGSVRGGRSLYIKFSDRLHGDNCMSLPCSLAACVMIPVSFKGNLWSVPGLNWAGAGGG